MVKIIKVIIQTTKVSLVTSPAKITGNFETLYGT